MSTYPNRQNGYYNIQGVMYPSVTTILSVVSKPALYYWHFSQAHTIISELGVKEVKELWSEFNVRKLKTMDRGSDIHNYLEAYLKKADYIPTVESPYMEAVKRFIAKEGKDFELVCSERQVWSPTHKFAGTVDAIIKTQGKVFVVDFKTNKDARIFDEASLQASAYQYAAVECGATDKIDARMIISFGLDGKYKIKSVDDCFDVFLSVKKLWEWQRKV